MSCTSSFVVGGLEFLLHMNDDRQCWETPPGFLPFQIPVSRSPVVDLNITVSPIPKISPERWVYDSGDIWKMAAVFGEWVIAMQSEVVSPEVYGLAFLDDDFHHGKVIFSDRIFTGHETPFPLSNPLGEVLMINLLSRAPGLIVHACGVRDGDHGLVFIAHSEVGKTTTARLWSGKGGRILNDDRIILRQQDENYWMYGTPWHGDLAQVDKDALPLTAVFVLRQANENSVRRLRPIEAVSSILSRSFPTYWNQDGIAASMSFLEGLCLQTPVFELNFVPNPSVVDYVRKLVQAL